MNYAQQEYLWFLCLQRHLSKHLNLLVLTKPDVTNHLPYICISKSIGSWRDWHFSCIIEIMFFSERSIEEHERHYRSILNLPLEGIKCSSSLQITEYKQTQKDKVLQTRITCQAFVQLYELFEEDALNFSFSSDH